MNEREEKFSEADFLLLREQDDQYILDNMELLKSKMTAVFSQEELNKLLKTTIAEHPFSKYVIDLLIECGADVDVQDVNGDTVLHLALSFDETKVDCQALKGRRDILVIALIENGAGIDIKNNDGETVFDICHRNEEKYSQVKGILEIHRAILSTIRRVEIQGVARSTIRLVKKRRVIGITHPLSRNPSVHLPTRLRKALFFTQKTLPVVKEMYNLCHLEVEKDFPLALIWQEADNPSYLFNKKLKSKLNMIFKYYYSDLLQCFPFVAPNLRSTYEKSKKSRYYLFKMAVESFSSVKRTEELRMLPNELRFKILGFLDSVQLEKFITSGEDSNTDVPMLTQTHEKLFSNRFVRPDIDMQHFFNWL